MLMSCEEYLQIAYLIMKLLNIEVIGLTSWILNDFMI